MDIGQVVFRSLFYARRHGSRLLLAGPGASRDLEANSKNRASGCPLSPSTTVTVLAFAGFHSALARAVGCLPLCEASSKRQA